jgi:hypothetical protein
VLPIATPVKLRLVGFAASAPTVAPEPESGMLSDGFDALLTIRILPVTLPAAPGLNVTVKLAVCPGCIVSPGLSPAAPKPVPVVVVVEITAAAVPPFVSVMVCDCDAPTSTFPKLALAGFAASDPEAKPDPVSVIVAVGIVPENTMLPFAVPADCGAKVGVKPAVCPGAKVKGKLKPLRLKPVPVATA